MAVEAPKKRKKYKPCRQCGERFEVKRKWQDFCKDECRYAFHHGGGPSFAKFKTLMQTELKKQERRILTAVASELRKAFRKLVDNDQIAKDAASRFRDEVARQLQTDEPAA